MNTFGERFKEERNNNKLTQEELANMFHLQKSSISRYENNKQIPEIEVLKKIADYFEVSMDYLLCRTNDKKSKSEIYLKNDSFNTLSPEVIEALEGYLRLDKENRDIINKLIENLDKKKE